MALLVVVLALDALSSYRAFAREGDELAAAVREQSTATAHIARTVNESSGGTRRIAEHVHAMQDGADETWRSSEHVYTLAARASTLRVQETFLREVR